MERVYKYVAPTGAAMFETGLIKITPPSELNDLWEMQPVSDWSHAEMGLRDLIHAVGIERQLAEICSEEGPAYDHNKAVKKVFEQTLGQGHRALAAVFREVLDLKIGVLSLSKRRDDARMWGHYADSHRGFVVEFDATHRFFAPNTDDPIWECGLEEVTYAAERPKVSVPVLRAEEVKAVFFTKHSCWEYEQEVRMIRPLQSAREIGNHDQCTQRGRESDGESSSKPIFGISFRPECVKGVVFGRRMSLSCRTDILRSLSRPEYAKVRIEEVDENRETYEIRFRRVDCPRA